MRLSLLRPLLLLLAFIAAPLLRAAPPRTTLGPPPTWVAPTPPAVEQAAAAPGTTSPAGLEYLLIEEQVEVATEATYRHVVYRVTSADGLQSAAEFSVDFDPAYESLELHHLRLRRGDTTSDRLDLEAFEVMRQERDRERYLYDGRITALLHLSDVRVGDVIDFAFTRRGWNPVFGGRYSDIVSTGWSLPVQQLHHRVTVPAGRTVAVQAHGPAAAPVRRFSDGLSEVLVWTTTQLPAIHGDGATPDWHPTYPFAQVSEFATWADVVAWALPLYDSGEPPAGELAALVEKLAREPTPEARVLAALAFVQDDVRYLGIELGQGSHRPRPPAQTFANRFGDCKDKSLLLCHLLQQLGIDAAPALVGTGLGPRLDTWLPTPLAFNHVITCVDLPSGRHWLDPTMSHLAGDLTQHAAPDYGFVLRIAAGETALTRLTVPDAARGRVHEESVYTSRGLDQPARLRVTTRHRGSRANSMRAYVTGRTVAELGRDYLNYTARLYPGATADSDPIIRDDRAANTFEIEENYDLPRLWERDDAGVYRAEFYPHLLNDPTSAPGSPVRTAPLEVAHPTDIQCRIVVDLHDDWNIATYDRTIEHTAFRYTARRRLEGRRLTLDHTFASRADHVAATAVASYAAELVKVRDQLTYELSSNPGLADDEPAGEAPFRLNLWSLAIMTLTVAAGGFVGWRVWQRRAPPPLAEAGLPPRLAPEPAPAIGGWLILPAIGLVIRPFMALSPFFQEPAGYFDGAIWDVVTTPGSDAYDPSLAGLVLFEVFGNTTLAVAGVIGAILFFNKRRLAPAWLIGLLAAQVVVMAIDLAWLTSSTDETVDRETLKITVQSVFQACIWIPYFLVSKRVKRTFVR